MKNILPICILIFFNFIFSGCSNDAEKGEGDESRGGAQVIQITKPMNDTVIYMSSLMDKVDIIPLELTQKSVIGEIIKLKIVDDRIYIQDKSGSSIYVYDINGKFLNTIGQQGKGPNEYGRIADFDVNSSKGHVLIHDNITKKIFEFQSDGTFIKEIQMAFGVDRIAVNNELIYLYMDNPTGTEFSLNIYDTLGQMKKQYFKSERREKTNMDNRTALGGSSFNRAIIPFQRRLFSEIYFLENERLNPAFTIDFGEHNLTDDAREQIFEDPANSHQILVDNKFVADVKNIHLLPSYLMFTYTYSGLDYRVFYNYKTARLLNSLGLFDDVSYLYFCEPFTQYKGRLVSVYYPQRIKYNIPFIENLIENGLPNGNVVSETGLETLEMLKKAEPNLENLNPYILLYSMKN